MFKKQTTSSKHSKLYIHNGGSEHTIMTNDPHLFLAFQKVTDALQKDCVTTEVFFTLVKDSQ